MLAIATLISTVVTLVRAESHTVTVADGCGYLGELGFNVNGKAVQTWMNMGTLTVDDGPINGQATLHGVAVYFALDNQAPGSAVAIAGFVPESIVEFYGGGCDSTVTCLSSDTGCNKAFPNLVGADFTIHSCTGNDIDATVVIVLCPPRSDEVVSGSRSDSASHL